MPERSSSAAKKAAAKRPTDALKVLQERGAQVAATARSFSEDFARAATGRSSERLSGVGSQIWRISTMWVTPIQALLDEQREFFAAMSDWARQQREFANRMEKLIERNQKINDQLAKLLEPFADAAKTGGPKERD